MEQIKLEPQQSAEPVDEQTRAALEIAIAQLDRGEGIPIEQVRENIKERSKAWRKTQEAALAA